MKSVRRICFRLLILAFFISGALMLMYPHLHSLYAEFCNRKEIDMIERRKKRIEEQEPEDSAEKRYLQLYEDMKTYNEEIFRSGQSGLADAWSLTQPPFQLSDYDAPEEAVGYLFIETMDVELPLYLGASEENLSRGAAVLGQTSMPIGGENSNCVIAAHRGWKGIPMFRDIELLCPGDKVTLANLWETLEYRVVKCIVITPDDMDAVKIVEGADMVTLVTCHPYTQNYQRYVVYCRREQAEQDSGDEKSGGNDADDLLIPYEGVEYEPSGDEIRREQLINYAGIALFAGVCAVLAAALMKKIFSKGGKDGEKRKNRQRKKRRKRRKHRDGIKKS